MSEQFLNGTSAHIRLFSAIHSFSTIHGMVDLHKSWIQSRLFSIVENERAKSQDRKVMDHILDKIAQVTQVLEANEMISYGITESSSQPEFSRTETDMEHHNHKTVKQ